jgi:2-polyprenyl-3-methyl-5-hydroxy-6-metoxy-1,4-benzoquinol methylase/tetratricopeptide (TPR) repeat protein
MRLGRNDPCICGSGKKYKKCCQQKLEAPTVSQFAQHSGTDAVPRRFEVSPSPAESQALSELLKAGRYGDLERQSRAMLERYPDSGFLWKMLGQALMQLDREGLPALQKAAALIPGDFEVHSMLSRLYYAQGNFMLALKSTIQSLRIKETAANKNAFVSCVKHMKFGTEAGFVKDNLPRALTEPWGRPTELAEAAAMLIKLDPLIEGCVIKAIRALPRKLAPQELAEHADIAHIANNRLLLALMGATAVCDIELERLLTTCREWLLDDALMRASGFADNKVVLEFYSALARQCFINEYVFALSDEEAKKARALRDELVAALKDGTHVSPLWPLAVGAYFPLYTLPGSSSLLAREWPDELQAVLLQQVTEPQQDEQERPGIPRLTPIEDEVSRLVQNQYEENPYPRWSNMATPGNAMTVDARLRQLFPASRFRPIGDRARLDVLVAGCGTGQQSIGAAKRYVGAHTLAIDLSMNSLAFAKRKTREMGVPSIEYAQADIMKLGSLDRRFDVIESCGVLHHLADPWAGWAILLSLLRDGGIMRLGLYSKLARRGIIQVREFIAKQGYGSTPDEIRRCRQDMLALRGEASIARILRITDFYSMSECRDLLFHVQENLLALPDIESFIVRNDLAFLGFEVNPSVLQAYKRRFPEDSSATNLGDWHIFETENPDTFIGMYTFWVQKGR